MDSRALVFAVCAATLAGGCSYSKVIATPSGTGIHAAQRPADCRIDFFRTKPPDRAYDELAALHFQVQVQGYVRPGPEEAQETVRVKACELGADAVVVTRDFIDGVMTGTALRYRN